MINSFIVFVVFVLTWHADIVGNCMMANLATLSVVTGKPPMASGRVSGRVDILSHEWVVVW